MKRQLTALLLSSIVLCSSVASRPVFSQDMVTLDRILNPLPEFDPFEQAPALPTYFPDEIDKRAREVLIDTLTNRKEALEDHLRFFKSEDGRLQKQHGTMTGLTEHVQDLVNNTIQDRERYLAAQKQALKQTSSAQRKKYLESIINHDDLNQAEQLMRQSSTNYWGGMLNRLLSAVDLVGIASGNYVGAAVETAVSQLYALADRDISVEDRRALARDLDHLKRFPDDRRNAEILKRANRMESRKKNALVKKQIGKSKEASVKGDLDKALFHAELASFLDPESREVEKTLRQVTELANEQQEARKKGLTAIQEQNAPLEQQEDVKPLLQALTLRDPDLAGRVAAAIQKKYRGKPLADGARDAEAVAMEMEGGHEAAKKIVEQLARSSVTPAAKQRAAALLRSAEYNLLASFRNARDERRLQSMKYVLLGEELLKKNLIYGAGAAAAAGPAGAATLGAVNALMMGNNLVQVLSNNPVSAQPVIDAGVAYVRNHPQSENATEIYKFLADAYEERGLFDKAVSYHELAGTPKEKIAAIKEKAAKALLNAAAKSKSRESQEYYLTSVMDLYPESPGAEEATKKLAALVKDENHGLRMSKKFLIDNPELYGPSGLGLKHSLLDGNPRNMELAERGANLLNERELLLYYQTPWGVRSQNYSLTKEMSDRFFMALRQKNHETAIADVNQRAKGSVGGIANLPLPILRGQREQRHEKSEPGDEATLALVREAGGPTPRFSKVLDHELLSETEKDAASKYQLPPIQGSVSASRFTLSGSLPAGLWGNRLAIGTDQRSPFAGMQLPIPLLEGFIPVDFLVQGRPGGVSIYPKIHGREDRGEDAELYR